MLSQHFFFFFFFITLDTGPIRPLRLELSEQHLFGRESTSRLEQDLFGRDSGTQQTNTWRYTHFFKNDCNVVYQSRIEIT